MQPFFFICHSAALCAYEFGIADDTAEFIKFFGYILLLPFAKLFGLFCHFYFLYIKYNLQGFILVQSNIEKWTCKD